MYKKIEMPEGPVKISKCGERAIRLSIEFQISLVELFVVNKRCTFIALNMTKKWGFTVTSNCVRVRLLKMGLKNKSQKKYHACPSMYDVQRGIER